ncbi:hypothetical protein ACFX2A_031405 [Malus domestica]
MTPESSKTTGNPGRSAFGAFLVSIVHKHFFLQSPSSLYICSHITMQSKANGRKKMASCSIALLALVCLFSLSNAHRVLKVKNPSGHEMKMRMEKPMGQGIGIGIGIGEGSDGEGFGEG